MQPATDVRIALANLRLALTPEESVDLARAAILEAGRREAQIVCFPECYVPGYRWAGKPAAPPNQAFLDRAWTELASCARDARIAVVLGTERVTPHGLLISALVIDADGTVAGFQDKEQMDPSEDGIYVAGDGRRMFQADPLLSESRSATRVGAIRKPFAGRPGEALESCFIRTWKSPSRAAIVRKPSRIRRTPSMRKPCCAAPRRTPAISRR